MNSAATDYIRHRLQKFGHMVDDTTRHFIDHGSLLPGCASAPYDEKCTILALLNSLSPSEPGRAALMEEYLRITQNLESFSKEQGEAYRDLLFSDLRDAAHAYHAAVCHAHLGQISPDAVHDLFQRDLIGELSRELKRRLRPVGHHGAHRHTR